MAKRKDPRDNDPKSAAFKKRLEKRRGWSCSPSPVHSNDHQFGETECAVVQAEKTDSNFFDN